MTEGLTLEGHQCLSAEGVSRTLLSEVFKGSDSSHQCLSAEGVSRTRNRAFYLLFYTTVTNAFRLRGLAGRESSAPPAELWVTNAFRLRGLAGPTIALKAEGRIRVTNAFRLRGLAGRIGVRGCTAAASSPMPFG